MFLIRQVLRFGLRLTYAQYSMYRYYAPIMHKLNGIATFRHDRFIHKSVTDFQDLSKLAGKMKLMFTCKKCNTRNSKLISKLAYDKGVIIVRCDGCKNNHLIADNLGWFTDISNKINIEKLMASKGESVRKIMNDTEGYFEAIVNEEFKFEEHKNMNSTIKDSANDNKCSIKMKEIEVSSKS